MTLFAGTIYDWLLGRWIFTRDVTGVAAGPALMTGEASFVAASADRAEYRESTVVHLPDGKTLRGSQRYLYVRRAAGFAVYFPAAFGAAALREDWLFEEVDFSAGDEGDLRGAASHHCVDDLYASAYAILPDGTFTVRHMVQGPRKDYELFTTYRRRV